jgi:hypothetical protein
VGFSGVVIVACSDRSLIELNSVSEVTEGLDGEEVRGEWRAGWFPGSELAEDPAALLEALVAETGTAALSLFVIDSDTVVVEGLSGPGGHWRSCLAWGAMQSFCEEDGSDFAASYLAPEAAAQAAEIWAAAGGLQTDHDRLLDTSGRDWIPTYRHAATGSKHACKDSREDVVTAGPEAPSRPHASGLRHAVDEAGRLHEERSVVST